MSALILWLVTRLPWLPRLLKALPWLLAVAGLVGTLWFREKATACEASKLAEALEAARQVAAAKAADAVFTRALEDQLRPITDAIRDQAHATTIALSKVKSDPNCTATPAARAYDSGVRPGVQAGPGPARPARP